VLPDDQAERIEAGFATADRATLSRWVQSLLDDRRARTSAFLAQTRRLNHALQRLRQAFDCLDALMRKAEEEASAGWPGKLPCPHCGLDWRLDDLDLTALPMHRGLQGDA
jgi:hypothetical protein